jgi:hypothetical protein
MLEQAIVDAAALREAALKNAEQSVIEKYAPEIKAAVNSLLESDNVITEQEQAAMDSTPSAAIEAPFAVADQTPEKEVDLGIEFEFDSTMFLDLGNLQKQAQAEEDMKAVELDREDTLELMDDLGLDDAVEEDPAEDQAVTGEEDALDLQEILDTLTEDSIEEVLEEELVVDMGQVKDGTFQTDAGKLKYFQEMELAKTESTKYKEENEALEKKLKDMKEAIESYKTKNKELYAAVKQLNNKLEESMLSNAKLIYSNRILGDASLNERQKDKIVEAIANAKTKDEAKTLCETLKATVGSTKNDGPKSLSESVSRKSNLSNILQRSKRNINENQEHSFSERMRKLAGLS